MITPPISSAELRSSRRASDYTSLVRAIDNLKKMKGLNMGDIVVKRQLMTNTKVPSTQVMNSNGLVQRYVIIHKDTYGFLYTKRFLLSGTLSKMVDCITATTRADQTYEVDVNYANSVILGIENSFDPSKDIANANQRARERKAAAKKNRRIDERNQVN